MELTGWTLKGRYRRVIFLQDVRSSEWWTNRRGINFALHLEDGSSVALKLKRAAGTWKFKVDALCGSAALDDAELPDEVPQKDAAA